MVLLHELAMRNYVASLWPEPLRNPASSTRRRMLPWLAELLKRKSRKLAAVALANKIARIAWKLMSSGEPYIAKSALTTLAGAV